MGTRPELRGHTVRGRDVCGRWGISNATISGIVDRRLPAPKECPDGMAHPIETIGRMKALFVD
jgi:hypothetical protein